MQQIGNYVQPNIYMQAMQQIMSAE